MADRYKILRKLPGKQGSILVDTVAILDTAKKRVEDLSTALPNEYFIFDSEEQCFVILRDKHTE